VGDCTQKMSGGGNVILRGKKPKKLLDLLFCKYHILILLLIGSIPILWYKPGFFIAKGDHFPYVFHTGSMSNDFYLWSSNNLGIPSPLSALVLYGFLETFLQVLTRDIGLWQIIIQMTYFTGAAFSMFYLSKTIYSRQKGAALVASIFYVFNIATLLLLLNIGLMWTWAFLPLLIALFIKSLMATKNVGKHVIFFALSFAIVASISSINMADIALIIISLSSVLFYYIVLERKIAAKCIIKNLTMALVITSLLSIWWIIPVVNYYILPSSMQFEQEVNVLSVSWTHYRASFLNLFRLNAVWGWRPEYSPYYDLYSNSVILSLLLFVPFLTASAALLFRDEKRKLNAYLMLILVFLIFLAKGLHEPFGFVNLLLYNYIPYMNMFRESASKFTMIMIPFLALLIGYSTDKLAGTVARKSRKVKKIVTVGFILAFMVGAFPIFINPIETKTDQIPYSSNVKIPQYWYEINDWFSSRAGDFRILVTPLDDYYQVPYSWGYYGSDSFIERLIQKPVISPSSLYAYRINPNTAQLMNQLRDTIRYGRTQEFETILDLLGVKYVLQRNDLDYEYMVSTGRDMPSPSKMREFLSSAPNIRLVRTAGELDVYEYLKVQPYLHIFQTEVLGTYDLEIRNTTVFTLQWDFSLTDELKAWRNVTLENQFGAKCTLYTEDAALKFEIWDSTWGWKIIPSPLIAIQKEAKYDLRLDIKGKDAHQVHIKMIEYNSNMEITNAEYVYFVGDGTFDWKNVRINYVPKNDNTTFLEIAIWSGSETNKPLPNIIWIDNVEIRGYVTRLDITRIQESLETAESNPPARIIGYQRLNPTKVVVKVEAFKPFMLTINEAHDVNWRAYLQGQTIESVPIFSVMNGFQINRTGQFEITIEYEPQKWFYVSSAISVATLLICATYLAYFYKKRRARLTHPFLQATPITSPRNSQEYLRSISEYSNSHWVEEVNYFCNNFLDVKNRAIIDIGCGLGHVLKKLPKNNRRLVGLDINRYLVSHAKAQCGDNGYDFVIADANSLPFTRSIFDHAFMIEVIEHMTEPSRTLKECARILRPGGELTLTTPNGLYYRMLHHRTLASPYHVNEYPFWEILRLIILAGFSLNRLHASNRWRCKSILRVIGKILIFAPFVPGRFYVEAKRK